MSDKVVDRDRGWKEIKGRLPALEGLLLKVGVLESAGLHDGPEAISMAELATVHEYGSGNIPQRSFIRSTMDEQRSKIENTLNRVGDRVLMRKMSPRQGLSVLGEFIKGAIQRKIVAGPFTPLAPSTIARKGSSRPLIDTSQLRNSISYEVVDGEGKPQT